MHFPFSLCMTLTLVAGVVYNYTAHGVQRDEAGWEQSVSIPLLQPGMFALRDQWDKYLEDFSTTGAWLPHRYGAAETTPPWPPFTTRWDPSSQRTLSCV